MKNDQVAVALRHPYGAMGQLKGWCRTQPAWREQQSLGLRDRIEARPAGKFSDVELEGKPMSPIGRYCCKSIFGVMNRNLQSR